MSMAWMPMGRWASAALLFAAVGLAMMVAIMLPSTLPVFLLFRRVSVFRKKRNPGWLGTVVGAGYFAVWLAFGMFPDAIGMGITTAAMKWDAVSHVIPVLGAATLVLAGSYQLTPLNRTCLQHCRDPLLLMSHHRGQGLRGAVHRGGSHGVYCVYRCWALMLVQLVQGVMSVRVMAVSATSIAMEKLLSHGYWVSRVFGGVFLGRESTPFWRLRGGLGTEFHI
jgi:predicted metal-binding membrane protein